MNKEPETYEELIRQKRCIDLSKYYELTKEQLEEIYNFLREVSTATFEETKISMASPVLVGDTLMIGEGIATKDENENKFIIFINGESDVKNLLNITNHVYDGGRHYFDDLGNYTIANTNITSSSTSCTGVYLVRTNERADCISVIYHDVQNMS